MKRYPKLRWPQRKVVPADMYSVADYGIMIADRVRMEAYMQALRSAVRPGGVVVDIGTGTGIFALLACRFGARRVYAIEPNDAIQVAREIARANGYAERIEFLQMLSTRAVLPRRSHRLSPEARRASKAFAGTRCAPCFRRKPM